MGTSELAQKVAAVLMQPSKTPPDPAWFAPGWRGNQHAPWLLGRTKAKPRIVIPPSAVMEGESKQISGDKQED